VEGRIEVGSQANVGKAGWFQCVLASKLANVGCTCQLCIAVAVISEVR
jgi:hypothetical protein